MKLRMGCNPSGVDPALWIWIGVIALHHSAWTGLESVLVHLRRETSRGCPLHCPPHPELVRAVDFRRHMLDERDQSATFCQFLRSLYPGHLKIRLEPEELTHEELAERGGVHMVEPLIHIELRTVEWPAGVL